MAHISVHLAQAEHNRAAARHLLTPPYHDWSMTAAFYAAIHYFEAWLFDQKEEHTEISIPVDNAGNARYTAHSWREQLIQTRMPKTAFVAFRLLRDASETARYLSLFRVGSSATKSWIKSPAPDYFDQQQAKELVERDLERVRAELHAEWRIFVEELDLSAIDPIAGPLARRKLVTSFPSKDDLLQHTSDSLRTLFGPTEIKLIQDALSQRGLRLLGSK